jgi:hypothetical protein
MQVRPYRSAAHTPMPDVDTPAAIGRAQDGPGNDRGAPLGERAPHRCLDGARARLECDASTTPGTAHSPSRERARRTRHDSHERLVRPAGDSMFPR